MPAKRNRPNRSKSTETGKGRTKERAARTVRGEAVPGPRHPSQTGLRLPFDVYFQDPFVSGSNPIYNFDEQFVVPWEPGLSSGPTSARFAVVDYDGGAEV